MGKRILSGIRFFLPVKKNSVDDIHLVLYYTGII